MAGENPIIAAAIARAKRDRDFRDDLANKRAARRVVRLSRKRKRTPGQTRQLSGLMSQLTLNASDAGSRSLRSLFSQALDDEK